MIGLGKKMLIQAGYVEIGMDHFALPEEELCIAFRTGKLHRNFMGYTTQPSKLMIGLGVSSISDTWTAFGQNIKTVEPYLDKVMNGHFPIHRGHILSEEDLYIRQVILDIMCHFKAFVGNGHSEDFKENVALLKEMENDKLITISEDGYIKVSKSGRPYVRNICMAFDNRLRRKQPDTQIFSMTV